MQLKNKKIILIAVTAAAAIGVFMFAPFGTQQIGNTVINGNYYDTPLEAYNHADANFDVKEEIATVDITEKSAIWLVYTDDSNEDTIVVEGMSVEDNKYYDLGDTALLNCQSRKNPQSKGRCIAWGSDLYIDDRTGRYLWTGRKFCDIQIVWTEEG